MKLPAFLLQDPQIILKKMIRIGALLLVLLGVLIGLKYNRDQEHLKQLAEEEFHKREESAKKMKDEVNWDDRLKLIVPDQEEMLTPNVALQLLIPPIINKIDVPRALVYKRTQRYTAAFEQSGVKPMSLWSVSAAAAPIDMSAPVRNAIPAIEPPLVPRSGSTRSPRPYRGVTRSYILLP